ncbi:MAG: S8 family serine peptidase [Lachnospiraceae bacterium]|nr:S8 family serine peptidase [Lachnospiraceae bacterium]
MKNHRLFKSLTIVTASILLVASSMPLGIQTFAQEEPSQSVAWIDMIDDMLTGEEYVEGEVIAIFDTAKLNSKAKKDIKDMETEVLAEVSSDAMEETFEPEVDTSASGGSVQLIAQDGKTTRQLLEELSDNPAVIWAEPNYIRQSTDIDDEEENDIHDGMDINNPYVPEDIEEEPTPIQNAPMPLLGAEEDPVTRVLATGKAVDLIQEQGYDSIGDLSHLQWGYREDATDLYSLVSPDWNKTGEENVSNTPVVAVIDSGIDYTHPDFDGIIMDMRPYSSKGGEYGYNCSGDGPEDDPMDDNGHGSHCAGIIASAWDGIGTSGVASGVKLCIVRASHIGNFEEANIIRAFLYLVECVDNGLNLYSVNCSFGGDGYTNAELLMANELGKRGVVTCVASGNFSLDNDDYPNTSSDFAGSSYTILVNASAPNYIPADYTDFGQSTTDIFSPGDAILSPVCGVSSKYFASVDQTRKVYDGFDPTTDPEKQVTITSLGEYDMNWDDYLEFEDTAAFKDFVDNSIKTGERIADPDDFDKNGYSYVVDVAPKDDINVRELFLVSIPVAEEDLSEISHFSFALKSTLDNAQTFVRTITFDTPSEDTKSLSSNIGGTLGWQRPSMAWTNMSYGAAVGTDEGSDCPLPYYNGRVYFLVCVCDSGASGQASKLYFDSIGAGNRTLRYAFLQGTSMATPAITGSTAVMYDKLRNNGALDGMTPAEKAEYVASVMKASVDPKESYASLCTSNGAFRFDIAPEDYTPVIHSVLQENQILVIHGRFFGEAKGTVEIGESDCTIDCWSDSEVRIVLPEPVTNQRLDLYLTAGNGKTTTKRIVTEGVGGKVTFDKTVDLPEELENCHFSTMTGLDGKLYVVPETLSPEYRYTKPTEHKQLWCYDPETDAWQRLDDVPVGEEYDNGIDDDSVGLATYEGLIFAYANYTVEGRKSFTVGNRSFTSEKKMADLMFLYNPETAVWTKVDLSDIELPMGGSIFATDNGVFFYGGYYLEVVEEEVEEDGVPVPVKYNRTEDSQTIFKLNFDLKEAKASKESIKVTSTRSAGETDNTYTNNNQLSSYGNQVVIQNVVVMEWLTWSEEEEKFTSEGIGTIPMDIAIVGNFGEPVGYIATFTCALTPDGLMVSAFSGDNYENRGYDCFYLTLDGQVTPFDKYAYVADLYTPFACVTDDYYYVWGDTYYGDEALGHLVYTKIQLPDPDPDPTPDPTPDPKPDPVVPDTSDTAHPMAYAAMFLFAIALMATALVFKKRERK